MIAAATRRFRTRRGSSFLTHGSDSYDKHGKRKTQRALDKALIEEQINFDEQEAREREQEAWDAEYEAEYEVSMHRTIAERT